MLTMDICCFQWGNWNRCTRSSIFNRALKRLWKWTKDINNKYGKIPPMPSNPLSSLLVKISSSYYGPSCPPVIIKEKDRSLRAQQRHQHASLLLCSERSTLSNPPAPDGPIYCTKWIVFGCTLYFQMLLWYPLSFSQPHSSVSPWFWPAQNCLATLWLVQHCWRAQQAQMRMLHYARLMGHTPAVKAIQLQNKDLQTLPFFDLMFLFHYKKGWNLKKKVPSSSYQVFSLKIGWNPVEKQRTETKGEKNASFAQFKAQKR